MRVSIEKYMNTVQPKVSHVTHDGQAIAGIGHFMVGVGAVIELGTTGTFLVMKRQDEFHQGAWEIVYGRLDQHEDFVTGLRREVQEETGISQLEVFGHYSFWHFYRGKKTAETEVLGISFACRTNQEEVKLSTEHSEYAWVTAEEMLKLSTVPDIHADMKKYLEFREKEGRMTQSQDKAARALADYQNLVRRQQDDRQKLARLANLDFVTSLLEPLEHLQLAAQQLNDGGLNMVLGQLVERLKEQGLEPIIPIDQPFDVSTMEAVDTQGEGKIVGSVIKPGWKLNGMVIQHAKVGLV